MTPHYHINVFWDAPSDCWVADVPDLKYCSAFGDTPDAALAEVQVAMEGFLESLKAHGDPIPEPRYSPPLDALRAA